MNVAWAITKCRLYRTVSFSNCSVKNGHIEVPVTYQGLDNCCFNLRVYICDGYGLRTPVYTTKLFFKY